MAVDLTQAHCRFLEEAVCNGKLEVFDEICDRGCRFHDPMAGDVDMKEYKQVVAMYRRAFPDLKPTILASKVHGDTVVTQWIVTGTHQGPLLDFQPTGMQGMVEGISIAQFRNGKMVKETNEWDPAGLLRELGPQFAGAGPARDIAAEVNAR